MSELSALISVVLIDLVLAGDNAVVVGMAAAGLPGMLRRKAIVIGIAAAALLRIVFAVFTTQILDVIGLVLIGGFLLLWVCWKLWREIHVNSDSTLVAHVRVGRIGTDGESVTVPSATKIAKPKTLRQAFVQIVVADVSMSLDNVMAVAGTARHHVWVLVIGLALSVALMGVAATIIAKILRRMPWISYAGLILIAWVAAMMIWEGGQQAWHHLAAPPLIPI